MLLALAIVLVALPAAAERTMDPAAAEAQARAAMQSGDYGFCKHPGSPLPLHARDLCPLAREIPDCTGFVEACAGQKEPAFDWDLRWLSALFGMVAKAFIWIVLLVIVVLLLTPIAQAIARARRNKKAADTKPEPAVVREEEAPVVDSLASDAERLLAQAEQHLLQGQLDRALFFFLHAALRALDERGLIRIERHKTNGEYVRECRDANAKRPLREIVREVDRVKWGGARADAGSVARAREHSLALVRAALVVLAVLALFGCSAVNRFGRKADPSEDGLFLDLLKQQGTDASRLKASLATLPMPKEDELAPVIVVDAERVPLEDDTRSRLVRWVEAGGVLVLAGAPSTWPKQFGAKPAVGSSRVALARDLFEVSPDDQARSRPFRSSTADAYDKAHLARPSALAWPDTDGGDIARLSSADGNIHPDGPLYAAMRMHGHGRVLGIANDDLLTNAGLARPGNARALVRILANLHRNAFQVARPEDGITPPASPIAALLDAGLGLGLGHAAFAVLLTFLAYGMRQGRPLPSPRPARRAFAEHVQATGALYARTRVAAHALGAYARYADARVRAQMPRGASDPAAFLAQRTGEDPKNCAELWARAAAAAQGRYAGLSPMSTLRDLSRLVAAATRLRS
jgi:hypothetical protein